MSNHINELVVLKSIKIDVIDIRLQKIISVISHKWTTLILVCLNNNSPLKYSEIKRLIPNVKDKVLVENLKILKDKKWIEIIEESKKDKFGKRKNSRYKISSFGKTYIEEVGISIYNLSVKYDEYNRNNNRT